MYVNGVFTTQEQCRLSTFDRSVAETALRFITMTRSCRARGIAVAAGTPQSIDSELVPGVRSRTGSHLSRCFQIQPVSRSGPDLCTHA